MCIQTFWLVLNYACNNRCQVCYAHPNYFPNSTFMTLQYAQDVIDEMSINGVQKCLLIGGEPTMHPDLFQIIKYVRQVGISATLITNGRKLSEASYLEKLLQADVSRIVISLQGSNSETHDGITKSIGSFQDTVNAIKLCCENDCNLFVLTTIQRGNADDCVSIPKFLLSQGVSQCSFNCGIPCVTKEGNNSEHVLTPTQIALIIEDIYAEAKKIGIKVDFNVTIPLCCFSSDDIVEEMLKNKAVAVGCQMYKGLGAAFDPRGNILPCTHFADYPLIKDTCQNNTFTLQGKFNQIWQDKNLAPAMFRQVLWRHPEAACQSCERWGACVGGCPLFWSNFNPAEFIGKKGVIF